MPPPVTLFLATSNPGKLRDFAAAAGTLATLAPLPGLATIHPPPEDAPTFAGNARAKALYYAAFAAPGQIVLADDSGLEVDALSGAPGVRSARYADDTGWPANAPLDQRNNACLLHALTGIPTDHRQARYRCALAAAREGAIILTAEGTVEGEILATPQGTGGFGYDPLFFLPPYAQTMAELGPAAKLACSHRGQALRHLLAALEAMQLP